MIESSLAYGGKMSDRCRGWSVSVLRRSLRARWSRKFRTGSLVPLTSRYRDHIMTALLVGYYGLVAIGDDWQPVTETERKHRLRLPAARDAGATHVGYWNGKSWRDVDCIDQVERGWL